MSFGFGVSAMSVLDYLPFVIALGIAAAIPGPGIAASVGKALASGFRPAFYFMNGLVLGDLTYLTLAVLGLAAVANLFSGFFLLVKVGGAAYLMWLAWNFCRSGIDPAEMSVKKGARFWPSLLAGYTVTLSNPKTIVFYMALLPTVIDIEAVAPENFAVLALLAVLVLYAVVLPYIILASRARVFLSNPRALKVLNRSAAAAMAGAAAFIVARH